MPRSYITDLTHFLDEEGQPADGPAGKLFRYLSHIVESGSVMETGEGGKIGLCCANPSQRKRCRAQLFAGRASADSVEWQCAGCGEHGIVSNWSGMECDLGKLRVTPSSEHCEATLQLQEVDALRRLGRVPRPLRALLVGTIDVGEGYLMVLASHDELMGLRDVALAAADIARGADRRLLDRFAARVDAFRTTTADFFEPDDPTERGPTHPVN